MRVRNSHENSIKTIHLSGWPVVGRKVMDKTMDTNRLDRIEKKLDESTIIAARIEERLIASQQRIDRLEYRADEQEADIENLRDVAVSNNHSVKIAERIAWLIGTGAVSFVVYYFR